MKAKTVFEESFKVYKAFKVPKVYNFGPFSGPIYPQKNQNVAKSKICAKTTSQGLSNNINPKVIPGIEKLGIFDL